MNQFFFRARTLKQGVCPTFEEIFILPSQGEVEGMIFGFYTTKQKKNNKKYLATGAHHPLSLVISWVFATSKREEEKPRTHC